MDLTNSNNFNNVKSTKDSIQQVNSENKNEEHKNITQRKNSLTTQSMQEETITILESDQDDLPTIKDKTEKTKKNHNITEPVNQFVDNSTSSLQINISLTPINVEESNDEKETRPSATRTKRLKRTSNTVQDNATEAAKPGKKYFILRKIYIKRIKVHFYSR